MECREDDYHHEAREHFRNKKRFLIHWLENSHTNMDWVDEECHSLHGLIEPSADTNDIVPESWPRVTLHDREHWRLFSCDDKLRNKRNVSCKEQTSKLDKARSRDQPLAEINRQWAEDNNNFVVWEKMPVLYGNKSQRNGGLMKLRERSQSVPPENRVHQSRSFNQQQLARQQMSDMYRSKDDIDKPPASCFPMQCCATSTTDFYSLASVNKENQRGNKSHSKKNMHTNYHPTLNEHSSLKDATAMPNVVPSAERLSSGVPYHDVHNTRRQTKSSICRDVMPDLLSSTDRPYGRHSSRTTSRAGSVSNTPQLLQYPVPLSPNVYRPLYIPSALHRASGSQTPCTLHKVPPQALTQPRSQGFNALRPDLYLPKEKYGSKMYSQNSLHAPFDFPQQMDGGDTYSNAGTTFTHYDIEQSGINQTGTSDLYTSASQNHTSYLKSASTTARHHTGKCRKSNSQARCMLKFGKKAPHEMKQPGYFSCPRKVDTLTSGEYVVLDTENQTIQVFSAKGVCDKVYQFKINILDMRVWSTNCIALLYQNQVGLFDFTNFQLQEILLQDILNPRVMDKMKDKNTSEKLFVVGTMSKIFVCDTEGEAKVTLGSSGEESEGTIFKRINAVTVDRRNNDIYILDSEYKSVFAYSASGVYKTKLDTTLCDLGPVFNPLGMCMSYEGHLLIADTFNHRILYASPQGLTGLIQYTVDYYPNHVKLTSDGRLLVAINSERRTFAGVRVYDYRNMPLLF